MADKNERLYGLIGYPLTHSFSQNYFNQKFESENINARYINSKSLRTQRDDSLQGTCDSVYG